MAARLEYSGLRFSTLDCLTAPSLAKVRLMPALLKIDTCPLAGSDRADAVWIVDEEALGALAGVEDVVVGILDGHKRPAVREAVSRVKTT